MRQAPFLIFNSLNAVSEFIKNLFFLKVVKKVGNLYIENTGNQIRAVSSSLER
jgi:hypothetical protein